MGAVVGGAIGAVAGGLTGKSVAEVIDPTVEEAYWKEKYQSRPYYSPGRQYYDYGTAYRYGWESAARPEYAEQKFEDIESDLETSWPSYRNNDKDTWQDFREAVRDAYNRVREKRLKIQIRSLERAIGFALSYDPQDSPLPRVTI